MHMQSTQSTYILPSQRALALCTSDVANSVQARRHMPVLCIAQSNIDDIFKKKGTTSLAIKVLFREGGEARIDLVSHANHETVRPSANAPC